MRCPNCGLEFQMGIKKNYTGPLFAILIMLLIAIFFVGIRMRGENEALKLKITGLEKKIAYYESTLLQYQKVIEQFTQRKPERK